MTAGDRIGRPRSARTTSRFPRRALRTARATLILAGDFRDMTRALVERTSAAGRSRPAGASASSRTGSGRAARSSDRPGSVQADVGSAAFGSTAPSALGRHHRRQLRDGWGVLVPAQRRAARGEGLHLRRPVRILPASHRRIVRPQGSFRTEVVLDAVDDGAELIEVAEPPITAPRWPTRSRTSRRLPAAVRHGRRRGRPGRRHVLAGLPRLCRPQFAALAASPRSRPPPRTPSWSTTDHPGRGRGCRPAGRAAPRPADDDLAVTEGPPGSVGTGSRRPSPRRLRAAAAPASLIFFWYTARSPSVKAFWPRRGRLGSVGRVSPSGVGVPAPPASSASRPRSRAGLSRRWSAPASPWNTWSSASCSVAPMPTDWPNRTSTNCRAG